jgi:RNA polymerase sigma factor (sigma-70 family)
MATSLKTGWHGEDISSISIGQLLEFSHEERCAFILQTGQDDLAVTIETLRECKAPLVAAMSPLRLAWALAWNLDGNVDGLSSRRGIRNYLDYWRPEVKWNNIWTVLAGRPPGGDSEATTLLGELCLSVACEQRADWQNESSLPLDLAAANQAFDFVYERNKAKVAGYVFKRFGKRAGAPDAIADEAWSRVFCNYWSFRARRRFLGLSRISTFVCQVTENVAYDLIRELEKNSLNEDAGHRFRNTALEELGVVPDSSSQFQADELQKRIKSCLSLLPKQQRIVATMVWVREMQAKRVAEALQISPPAVSEHLKKARAAMRNCLQFHGFQVSGAGDE